MCSSLNGKRREITRLLYFKWAHCQLHNQCTGVETIPDLGLPCIHHQETHNAELRCKPLQITHNRLPLYPLLLSVPEPQKWRTLKIRGCFHRCVCCYWSFSIGLNSTASKHIFQLLSLKECKSSGGWSSVQGHWSEFTLTEATEVRRYCNKPGKVAGLSKV